MTEAERELVRIMEPIGWNALLAHNIEQALLSERRKGWEMCREAAALKCSSYFDMEAIRSLPFPEDTP